MRRLLSLLTLSTAVLFSAAAHADTYNFTFTDTTASVNGSFHITGYLDTRPGIANTVIITGITGSTYGGSPLTLVNNPTPGDYYVNSPYGYDNVLITVPSPGTYFFDGHGILFTIGNYTYNLYDNHLDIFLNNVFQTTDNVVYSSLTTVASTPEPSSLMLLGTGMIALVGSVRRKMIS